jgi:hypothetical protein
MGTTQAFYGLVHNLNYFKERWNLFVALAPPISLKGMSNSPVLKILIDEKTTNIISKTFRKLKIYEVYPANFVNSGLFKTLCLVAPDICKLAESIMADTNPDLNNKIATQVYFGHYPSGSSLKTMEHFT